MSGLYFFSGEGLRFLASLVGLGALVGLGEALRAGGVAARTTRRLVHAGVSLFVAATPLLFTRPLPVYGLTGLFVVLNFGAHSRGWWAGIHAARPESWGTVALPLSVFPALAATWSIGADRIFILQAAFLTLGVADPLASWVGESWRGAGRREWVPDATGAGSGMFLGTSFLLTSAVLLRSVEWGMGQIMGVAAMVSVVATAVEGIGRRGWDNLFVVLAIVLPLGFLAGTPSALASLSLGLVVGGGVAFVAYWSRALDPAGAVGGGLFAAALVGMGGGSWAVPGFAFFVLSSALSWLPGRADPSGETASGRAPRRTLRQVVANGGIAWALLGAFAVLPSGEGSLPMICYAGFLGALTAAAADTWATELGARLSKTPRSLRTFRRVPAGASGAVSVVGTVAAVLGAASVAGAAWLIEGGLLTAPGEWIGVGAAGLVGMAADSLAGATVQAQYRDPETEALVERPVPGASPVQGWAEIDNEVVNFLGTATGAAVAVALAGSIG